MLKFIASLFGVKTKAPVAPTPYKVEAPKIEEAPSKAVEKPATDAPSKPAKPAQPAKVAKPKAEKKPAVKAKTARKPRAPKA